MHNIKYVNNPFWDGNPCWGSCCDVQRFSNLLNCWIVLGSKLVNTSLIGQSLVHTCWARRWVRRQCSKTSNKCTLHLAIGTLMLGNVSFRSKTPEEGLDPTLINQSLTDFTYIHSTILLLLRLLCASLCILNWVSGLKGTKWVDLCDSISCWTICVNIISLSLLYPKPIAKSTLEIWNSLHYKNHSNTLFLLIYFCPSILSVCLHNALNSDYWLLNENI